jgi:hypothetical protein
VLAQTPYHTFVLTAGFAATLFVAIVLADELLLGTTANKVAGGLIFVCEVVGPAPKPPTPSTL